MRNSTDFFTATLQGGLTFQGKSVFQTTDRIAVAKLAQSFGDRRETECLRGDRYFLTTPQIEKLISPASRTGPVTIDQC